MAKTKIQKSKGKLSTKCAKMLVMFVNAIPFTEGLPILETEFRKAFRLQRFLPEKWLVAGKNDLLLAQRRLAKLIDEHINDRILTDSDTISDYDFDYYMLCHSQNPSLAQDHGRLDKLECFKNGGVIFLESVLAFCVHHYIQDEDRKPILKCNYIECGKYFVADKITKRFCKTKHRVYQNRINKAESVEVTDATKSNERD